MAASKKRQSQKIGILGEEVVAAWLTAQGWNVLHSRWRCRWGELDLIMQGEGMLIFVEVKTRSARSWDSGGLLAITPQKQGKLWQAAEMFLGEFPQWVDVPCRFDLALVRCRRAATSLDSDLSQVQMGESLYYQGYEFAIADYLTSIFD